MRALVSFNRYDSNSSNSSPIMPATSHRLLRLVIPLALAARSPDLSILTHSDLNFIEVLGY